MSCHSQLTLARGRQRSGIHTNSPPSFTLAVSRRTARSKNTSKLKQEGDLKRRLLGTNSHKLWQLHMLPAWVTSPNKSPFTRGGVTGPQRLGVTWIPNKNRDLWWDHVVPQLRFHNKQMLRSNSWSFPLTSLSDSTDLFIFYSKGKKKKRKKKGHSV